MSAHLCFSSSCGALELPRRTSIWRRVCRVGHSEIQDACAHAWGGCVHVRACAGGVRVHIRGEVREHTWGFVRARASGGGACARAHAC